MNDGLLSLPFDHYERYALTARSVEAIRARIDSKEPLRILDVGGRLSSLKHWLPNDQVVLADPGAPPTHIYGESIDLRSDGYVCASGLQLPFPDDSFDIVASHDTLEHIPPGGRDRFIAECIRVAKRSFVLNGPVDSEDARAAERRLATFWERALEVADHALVEHLANGLPEAASIEAAIEAAGEHHASLPNGNLGRWLGMMAMKYHAEAMPDPRELHAALDRTYNTLKALPDDEEPCYRRLYVVVVGSKDATEASEVVGALRTAGSPSPQPTVERMAGLVDALEDHAIAVRGHLNRFAAGIEGSQTRIDALQSELNQTQLAYRHIVGSTGYRVLEKSRSAFKRAAPPGTRRQGVFLSVSRALHIAMTEGWRALFKRLRNPGRLKGRLFAPGPAGLGLDINTQYNLWLQNHALDPSEMDAVRERAAALQYRPLISVIMPVYNTERQWLVPAIESVRTQLYDNWELCIADDGSDLAETKRVLSDYTADDDRIRVTTLAKNLGIGGASAAALALAQGDFIALLDHDDELKPDALYEVVARLNEEPSLDYIYTDEDKKDAHGRLVDPFFKPDWSPDLFMSVNYVTHLSVIRRELAETVGGFRLGYDGSQDYDLLLRMTEQTDRIAHIPKPLYTWRKIGGSAAGGHDAKPYARDAAKRALQDALDRRKIKGNVFDGSVPGYYRVTYALTERSRVSIVIPTKDRLNMLKRCIDSISARSRYDNYEIVVVDNGSTERATLQYLEQAPVRVVAHPGEFNFSALINAGVRASEGEHVVLLNNDTEVIEPSWIEAMLEHDQRAEVGAVGARLLYPDGTVQHEGVIVGRHEALPAHLDHRGYFSLGEGVRNLSAVTAACMMIKKSVFEEVGGFDEELRIAYNDVDFCLRLREKGYLVIYTPHALLYHYEGATRGRQHPPDDDRLYRERWYETQFDQDPYYNPNLDPQYRYNLKL